MAYRILYPCTNEGATWGKLVLDPSTGKVKTAAGGGLVTVSDVPGACFGYSFDWARRMLTGDPKTSKPSVTAAVPLQQIYEIKLGTPITDQRIHAAIRAVGVKTGYQIGNVTKKPYKKVVDVLVKNGGGVSVLKMNIHWVGAGWMGGDYYLFDSNIGLLAGPAASDMTLMLQDIHNFYTGTPGYNRNWDIFEILCGTQ
jgi:hypothetical protein